MKILTWNINGIRAAQGKLSSIKNVLDGLGADVICLQETKITRDMMDEPTAIVDGYESFFSFSRKRTGYSGTANYCVASACPCQAEEGLTGRLAKVKEGLVGCYGDSSNFTEEDLDALDAEGRCVITKHRIRLPSGEEKELAIINVYVPRAGEREDRHIYKLQFLTLLQLRAEALLKDGIHVIVLGDLNLSHKAIDNCEPKSVCDSLRRPSRIWINRLLQESERDPNLPEMDHFIYDMDNLHHSEGGQFCDTFRRLHPTQADAFTNWCTTTGARQTNYGRRLDYILADKGLVEYTTDCDILRDVEGSDHCPVILTLDCQPVATKELPPLASKFMPEFKGQQRKLSSFFSAVPKQNAEEKLKADPPTQKSNSDLSFSFKSDSNTTLEQQKGSIKRGNSTSSQVPLKKQKLKSNEPLSKQRSLTSFFSQPKSGQPLKKTAAKGAEKNLSTDTKPVTSSTDAKPVTSSTDAKMCSNSLDPKAKKSAGNSSTDSATSDHATKQSGTKSKSSSMAWKSLLSGLPPAPLCPGHKELCVLRTVRKDGPTKNKQFYVCARPEGGQGNKEARCNFFLWMSDHQLK